MSEERTPYTLDPDTQLMMKFAAGDDDAFEKIVESFQRQVFAVIYRYIGTSHGAEDCAQEVFIRLYRMRRTYRPTARLSTLVYRIAANLCMNRLRNEARRRALPLDAVDDEGASLAAALADPNAAAPHERLETEERARLVRQALGRIPDRQRMAIVLHRFEGLSYKDIAEAMETNVDAVKSLLSRARRSLAEELAGDVEAGNI